MATPSASTGSLPPAGAARQHVQPLPLDAGDRLTRCEFERRYAAMPNVKKAELIEGIVHMSSPVRADSHAEPHALVMGWLVVYRASTANVSVLDNATVRLDLDNEPQPDALLRIESAAGGQSQVGADQYVEGPPELVVEVAASSATYDLHDKRNAYRRNGVLEYIVWRVYDKSIDWFVLADGEYRSMAPDSAGVLRSRAFPGLWLDTDAMLAHHIGRVLAELRRGVEAPEHTDFVAALRANACTED